MSQIALPFDWPADAEKSDFLITSCNRDAADHLEHWGRWPVRASVLVGPRKSGRSLLGRIFAANTGGTVIDDAEMQSEAAIFHAWNDAQNDGLPLLILTQRAPSQWPVRLPDLKSRLGATPIVTIDDPDILLCEQLIMHLLGRRGIAVPLDVSRFIVTRMERTFIEIQRVVDALDEASLSSKRAITKPFATEKLGALSLINRHRVD